MNSVLAVIITFLTLAIILALFIWSIRRRLTHKGCCSSGSCSSCSSCSGCSSCGKRNS